MTHTHAELKISPEAFDEIYTKLRAAGYEHAFMRGGAIDMNGLALTRASAKSVGVGAAEVPHDEARRKS